MLHQEPASIEPASVPAANDRTRTTRSLTANTVTFASVVLASLAPGLTSGAPAGASAATSAFVAVGPHRLADTRSEPCGCDRLDEFTIRVTVAGRFGIPGAITAAAVTVTTTNVRADGFVSAYPAGTPVPLTSILNPRAGSDLANSAIVSVGANGAIEVRSTLRVDTATDLIVDVTGVFVPRRQLTRREVHTDRTHPHLGLSHAGCAGHGGPARNQHQPPPTNFCERRRDGDRDQRHDCRWPAHRVPQRATGRSGILDDVVHEPGRERTGPSRVRHRPRVARRFRHHHHSRWTRDRRHRRLVHRSERR